MNTREAWSLRPDDLVVYDGEVWTVRKNDQQAAAAQIVHGGWIECVSWRYLKRAPKVPIQKFKQEVVEL